MRTNIEQMKVLGLDIHRIELRSVSDITRGYSLHIECQTCWKLATMDLQALPNVSPATPIRDIRLRARCSRCDSKDVQILLCDRSMHGRRAWLPRAPRGRRE